MGVVPARKEVLSVNCYKACFISFLFFAAASQVIAQPGRQITSIDRRVETMNRQTREYERDNMGREGKKSKEEAAKRTRLIRLEIEEDLKALQAAYNEIVLALQDGTLKTGFAAEAARSIAKHSARLKINLALPTTEEETPAKAANPLPADEERPALKALGRCIYDFITNPIFEGTTALDVKESTRASRDLDAVIALANSIASR